MKRTAREAERGQALVEFALTIPIVFVLIGGVIDFGRALYTYDLVAGAARIGSRYAMVRGPDCTAAPGCTATSSQIQTYVRSTLTGIDPTTVTVTTTWPSVTGCAGGSAVAGCPVAVTVTCPFKFVLLPYTMSMSSQSQLVVTR